MRTTESVDTTSEAESGFAGRSPHSLAKLVRDGSLVTSACLVNQSSDSSLALPECKETKVEQRSTSGSDVGKLAISSSKPSSRLFGTVAPSEKLAPQVGRSLSKLPFALEGENDGYHVFPVVKYERMSLFNKDMYRSTHGRRHYELPLSLVEARGEWLDGQSVRHQVARKQRVNRNRSPKALCNQNLES